MRRVQPPKSTVADLIATQRLVAHFQPIVDLHSGAIHAHEALIRGPAGAPLATPDALFAAARAEHCEVALELECMRRALAAWGGHDVPGKLFINMSAHALTAALSEPEFDDAFSRLSSAGVSPASIVIELTEHERVADMHGLQEAGRYLREHGVTLALDDFGDGRSSLRLWSELKPAVVKIDKYFTADLPRNPDKLQTFRALLQIADTFGSQVVAEGIEHEDELRLLRDLGVHLGQGWFLGRPAPAPVVQPLAAAQEVIRNARISVMPERRWASTKGTTAANLLVEAPAVVAATSNDEVFALLSRDDAPHALAVVDEAQRPLALIDRNQFIASYVKPYFREINGRRSCIEQASRDPLCVDEQTGIEELTSVLTSRDQRYLRHGFVITRGGRYRGLGTGEALVKSVTESRIEAARHANPLTLLPGNIPISQHIGRLLDSGSRFVAAYFDLDHFKPFNDQYGYWRGDDMIRLAARIIAAHADLERDFVGHVGGDDFMVLFQSDDWQRRCEAVIADFNARALELFDAEDATAGGIMAEDRYGNPRFHPCTTMCIGAVGLPHAQYRRSEDVASAAAAAKRRAKRVGQGLYLLAEEDGASLTMPAPL